MALKVGSGVLFWMHAVNVAGGGGGVAIETDETDEDDEADETATVDGGGGVLPTSAVGGGLVAASPEVGTEHAGVQLRAQLDDIQSLVEPRQ